MTGFFTRKNLLIALCALLLVAAVSVVLCLTLLGGDDGEEPWDGDMSKVTYEIYEFEMTPDQRREYYATFESFSDFADWYNAGKEAYDAEHQSPSVGDGGDGDIEIDLGGK